MRIKRKMPPIDLAILDVGGPIRDSSRGMNYAHEQAFEQVLGKDYNFGAQATWQLYAVPGEVGYQGLIKSLLAWRTEREVLKD